MNATELLANTLSSGIHLLNIACTSINRYFPDTNTRQDATQKLENASRENYVRPSSSVSPFVFHGFSFLLQPEYMVMLSSVLVDESSPLHVRNAAGLALKNALSARVRNRFPSSHLILNPLRTLHGKPIIPTDG